MSGTHTNYINKVLTQGVELSAADAYILGEPKHLVLSYEEYQKLESGDIDWQSKLGHDNNFNGFSDIGKAGIVVVNKANATSDDKFAGRYITVSDNTGLMPTESQSKVVDIKSFKKDNATEWTNIPYGVLSFPTSGDNSLSKDISKRDNKQDTVYYNDYLTVDVIDIKTDKSDINKLVYELTERHIGTLNYHHTEANVNGGNKVSYLQDLVEETSDKISVLVNPNFSKNSAASWKDKDDKPIKTVRVYGSVNHSGSLSDYDAKYEKYKTIVEQNKLTNVPTVSAETLTESMYLSGYIASIGETNALGKANNAYNLSRYAS